MQALFNKEKESKYLKSISLEYISHIFKIPKCCVQFSQFGILDT